jgi:hypothetical protein
LRLCGYDAVMPSWQRRVGITAAPRLPSCRLPLAALNQLKIGGK